MWKNCIVILATDVVIEGRGIKASQPSAYQGLKKD